MEEFKLNLSYNQTTRILVQYYKMYLKDKMFKISTLILK